MKLNICENWKFYIGENEYGTVSLPHDAMLLARRYPECRSGVSGAYFSGGIYTYKKEIEVPESWLEKRITLFFEGVYKNATVYVNDKKVSFHANGFTEFSVEISEFVNQGKNILKVVADNSLVPNCRWYTGSGIYRPVWLEVSEKDFIDSIKVNTVSYSEGIIEISAKSKSDVMCEIYDVEKIIAKGSLGRFTIENAHLWSSENPHLYTLKLKNEADEREVKFGIRKIEWNATDGFLVNGKRVLLRGGCIHHDNGVLGACSYKAAEYRRIRILKEQGFNAIRVSHNPAARYLLDACDELGMYVIDEAFDGWYIPKEHHDYSRDFWDNYEDDLKSMIKKDFNRPSVIMYSVGNEVTETASQKGIELCGKLRDIVKSIDDTRPVTCGINVLLDVYVQMGMGVYKDNKKYERRPLPEDKKYNDKKAGSAFFNALACKVGKLMFFMSKGKRAENIVKNISSSLDIVGLNYAASRYDIDAKKYPERLMLGTETMVSDLPYNWERVKKYPQLFGDFVWAAWDYLGEACIGDWTYYSYKGLPLLAGQGMIDITGKPLAAMAYMQVVWGFRKTPFIAVRPINHNGETPSKGAWQFTNAIDSWNWRGYENKKAVVEIYSEGDYVELYLNSKKIGQKKLKNYKAIFNTKYQNGTIEAVSFDSDGNKIASHSLSTGSSQIKITVKCDRQKISKDELVFAEIEFTDDKGELIPYMENRVKVTVDGKSVELLGMGSSLCKTDERFTQNYYNAYRGRCLAVFKGIANGTSTITASANDLAPATIKIEVE